VFVDGSANGEPIPLHIRRRLARHDVRTLRSVAARTWTRERGRCEKQGALTGYEQFLRTSGSAPPADVHVMPASPEAQSVAQALSVGSFCVYEAP
jgi:hypothetical protein